MKMIKIAIALPICAALLATGGCAERGPDPIKLEAEKATQAEAQKFAQHQMVYKTVSDQFTDIPVPNNVSMNVERTIVLGATGAWLGRLVLSSQDETTKLFDFYKTEMPGMGWHEMTAVRAIHSVMSYSRLGRIATIQIHPGKVSTSEVVITASPERAPYTPGTASNIPKKPSSFAPPPTKFGQ
ncbi:MAG: hypothetical protein OQJ97_06460 [Rhodospirillales bacterium]|nr:hypothetical protein [Rhodospirillales bacterium]